MVYSSLYRNILNINISSLESRPIGLYVLQLQIDIISIILCIVQYTE